ncbi:uncharacterized protein A4U43_C04F8940 [Asparagus officinalis]|uniref:C2 NT-type domain-containing protein n=1 Tax=Asparagus officinalis TaxID=4686 RepID=A0A5P1EZE6_ASPOF|nr:uncharacterized protein A4U43_C04F8940 [Asparagus officinalis]
MFRAARWRSEKNKIKAMFKLQFKATQVPGKGWEAVMVTLVPVDIGKPSLRSEKIAVVNGECRWLNPMYETVKLTQDQKTGKISDKVYQFIVSATGQAKTGVLGEINVNLAEYAEVYKPTSVSLPLQDSNNGAILHVTIQRVQNDAQGREAVENGETPKEGNENKGNFAKSPRITLKSQLSNPENEEGGKADTGTNDINAAEEGSFINSKALVKFHSSRNMPSHGDSSGDLGKSSSFDGVSASAHLSIINDLESHVENLEKELEKQSEEYEANLANLVRGKVEEEQRAIQAEEELRKTRWKNANTVEQLQGEFKRLSSQISTTFCANEDLEDIDTKSFGDENRNILDINVSQFLEKIIQDEDFVDHSHDTTDERLRRNLDANTKAEVETLASCPYDQNKLAEVLSQMEELKEQNESMEAELKEMQQRYSEMSLKFAEVEGERQQLVIRIRTLKNAMKN